MSVSFARNPVQRRRPGSWSPSIVKTDEDVATVNEALRQWNHERLEEQGHGEYRPHDPDRGMLITN